MVEMKQLRYFIAIAETGSFSKAAKKLYISQPALSQQISKLEEQVGVNLIERNTRSVQLTAAGRDFYLHAIGVLMDVENMMQSVVTTDSRGFLHQTIRVCLEDGVFSLAGTGAYEFLRDLRHMDSAYTIECLPALPGAIPRLLSEGKADIALTFLSDPTHMSPNMVERCFHRGRLALAVPKDWDFELGSPKFTQAINNSSLYFPYDRASWNGIINAVFANLGLYPYNVTLENFQSALNYVAGGDGVFVAPEVQLRQNKDILRIVRLENPLAEYRASAVYLAHNRSVAMQRVLDLLPDPGAQSAGAGI